MLFTTHSVLGATLGVATGDPKTGFILGFLSHHLIDAMPHFDQGSFYVLKGGPTYIKSVEKKEIEVNGYEESFGKREWIMFFIDVSIAAILFLIIFHTHPPKEWLSIIAGAIGGLLPDIIDSSPLWSEKLRAKIKLVNYYHRFHSFFHWTVGKENFFWELLTQFIIMTFSLYYLVVL